MKSNEGLKLVLLYYNVFRFTNLPQAQRWSEKRFSKRNV